MSDALLVQAFLHARADAGQIAQRQVHQRARQQVLGERNQAVGLVHVGGDLRQVAVRREADGAAQCCSDMLADGGLHATRQIHGRKQRLLAADQAGGHLVDGHDGRDGNAALDRLDDPIVIVDVNFVARLDQLQAWTHPFRFADLRAGTNPEGLRLVACCDGAGSVGHDGHDGDRAPAEFRPQLLLDRGEVGVQIEEEPPQAGPGILDAGGHALCSSFLRLSARPLQSPLGAKKRANRMDRPQRVIKD